MFRPSLAHAALVVVVGVADTAHAEDTVESTTLSLADALRAAEPASESLQAARSEVDRAKAGVDQAKSGYLPRVDSFASYTRAIRTQFDGISFGPPAMMEEETDEDTVLPFGQRNTWRVGFTAVQPIFDGFRTRATVKQARSGVRVAELGVTATRSQLVLQVAAAYFDAALAQRQVEIAEVTLGQSEEILKQTTLNYQQGAAPEFDLVRAQVARDNQSTTLTQFKAQRDVAFVQLARLVGAPLNKPFALTTTLADDDIDTVVAEARQAAGLPATSSSRLAVQQAKENVVASEAGLEVAKADRLPQLIAQSDLAFIDFADTPFNTDWRTDWTVQLTLSMPLFDGFRRKAVVQANRAAVKAARAQLDQIGEVAQVEIAQANANVAASATTFETTTRTVQQAKRAYEIAELRFDQGASTHLEIVDARVQLEQALLNQARSARDLRVARLRQELLPGLPLGQ